MQDRSLRVCRTRMRVAQPLRMRAACSAVDAHPSKGYQLGAPTSVYEISRRRRGILPPVTSQIVVEDLAKSFRIAGAHDAPHGADARVRDARAATRRAGLAGQARDETQGRRSEHATAPAKRAPRSGPASAKQRTGDGSAVGRAGPGRHPRGSRARRSRSHPGVGQLIPASARSARSAATRPSGTGSASATASSAR